MTFLAHFHGGPRAGTSRHLDVEQPPLDVYLDDDEEEDLLEHVPPVPVRPGQPYPTLPDSHYTLRGGPIGDGLHYDWQP